MPPFSITIICPLPSPHNLGKKGSPWDRQPERGLEGKMCDGKSCLRAIITTGIDFCFVPDHKCWKAFVMLRWETQRGLTLIHEWHGCLAWLHKLKSMLTQLTYWSPSLVSLRLLVKAKSNKQLINSPFNTEVRSSWERKMTCSPVLIFSGEKRVRSPQ